MKELLQITFTIPASKGDECSLYLSAKVRHGWEETPKGEDIVYSIYLEDHLLGEELIRDIRTRWPECGLTSSTKEPEDWAMAWKDFFNPVTCGETFEILPPWLADQAHGNTTPIVIEPKMAFGTGHHPTTALCLEAVGELYRAGRIAPGMRFLDLGTGSGILAIALAKLELTGVGLDIDPEAIPCAVENAAINNVAEPLEFAVGSADCLISTPPFDFIISNILSGPLIELAPEILSRLAPGAPLTLSGILVDQAPAVAEAYTRRGLPEPIVKTSGEWAALVWERT